MYATFWPSPRCWTNWLLIYTIQFMRYPLLSTLSHDQCVRTLCKPPYRRRSRKSFSVFCSRWTQSSPLTVLSLPPRVHVFTSQKIGYHLLSLSLSLSPYPQLPFLSFLSLTLLSIFLLLPRYSVYKKCSAEMTWNWRAWVRTWHLGGTTDRNTRFAWFSLLR